MPPRQFLRPYAALAIIEHEFDVDHLNIWIVFKFAMDTDNKPANALWIVEADDVVKAVTTSAWLDEWTLLLTLDTVADIPDRVTVEYDGPDTNLKIRWGKQWEPWGPILSTGPVIVPYGSFKGNEIDWVQAAAQNVWYTISDADITEGLTFNTTFQNNQEIKVAIAGVYQVNYYLCIRSSIANKHVLSAPGINGVEQLDGRNHVEFGAPNIEVPISGSALLSLAIDDLITIEISTLDAGNPTLTVHHIGLTLVKIEGT